MTMKRFQHFGLIGVLMVGLLCGTAAYADSRVIQIANGQAIKPLVGGYVSAMMNPGHRVFPPFLIIGLGIAIAGLGMVALGALEKPNRGPYRLPKPLLDFQERGKHARRTIHKRRDLNSNSPIPW
jgi:hypothetical protein